MYVKTHISNEPGLQYILLSSPVLSFTGSTKIKSNQITFIVTSSQHMRLGEWNSWERAPYSAETINI